MSYLRYVGRVVARLRNSFWFIPGAMVLVAIVLALALVDLDVGLDSYLRSQWPELFSFQAEGSRSLLAAIASSMITVAGVTFSITIVTLSLAASQYTPRILRNFIRDRRNQFVLGVFVAVYAYTLVVLRTIRGGEDAVFVPALAVSGGILLALLGIGVLIFFIHHIAVSIQASSIIQDAAHETLHTIDHLYPDELDGESDVEEPDDLPAEDAWRPVPTLHYGYLQKVDPEHLVHFAARHDAVVRMDATIGDFVVRGGRFVSIASDAELTEKEGRALHGPFTFDRQRTVEQDVAFGIRQIVDIALKALSPGVNDTTTADVCIDHLTNILAAVAPRKLDSQYRFQDGKLRAVMRVPTFERFVEDAFEQIRQNADGNVRILNHLLHATGTVATFTKDARRLETLRGQARLVRDSIERTVPCEEDRDRSLAHYDEVCESLSRAA